MREARYVANDDRITAFNAEEHSWTIGHNKFSDWTTEEYQNMLMKDRQETHPGAAINRQSSRSASYATSDHLDSYTCSDCTASVVNVEWAGDASGNGDSIYPNFPTRDQESCGSCYCHTAAYASDFAYRIFETPDAVDGVDAYFQASVQQCVDCSSATTSNAGCQGGFSEYSFDYWMDAYITEDSAYPYTSGSTNSANECEYSEITPFTWTDSDSGNTLALNVGSRTFANASTPNRPTPDQLKTAVTEQPLAIALCADDSNFMSYTSGIYDPVVDDCECYPNHTILLVGYGYD